MKQLKISCLLLLTLVIPVQAASLKPGDLAPDFTLHDTQGNVFSLKNQLQKSHVMIVFWELECVYCFSHIRDFNAINEKYRGKLKLVAINFLGEYADDVAKYKKDNNVRYTLLAERLNNIDVAEAYRIIGSPTMIVIEPSGKIIYYGYKLPDLDKLLN